jgi:hypothetical protein
MSFDNLVFDIETLRRLFDHLNEEDDGTADCQHAQEDLVAADDGRDQQVNQVDAQPQDEKFTKFSATR